MRRERFRKYIDKKLIFPRIRDASDDVPLFQTAEVFWFSGIFSNTVRCRNGTITLNRGLYIVYTLSDFNAVEPQYKNAIALQRKNIYLFTFLKQLNRQSSL